MIIRCDDCSRPVLVVDLYDVTDPSIVDEEQQPAPVQLDPFPSLHGTVALGSLGHVPRSGFLLGVEELGTARQGRHRPLHRIHVCEREGR